MEHCSSFLSMSNTTHIQSVKSSLPWLSFYCCETKWRAWVRGQRRYTAVSCDISEGACGIRKAFGGPELKCACCNKVDVFVVWDQSIYVTGVVTIAAVATLAVTLFSPCNNIHDRFLKCYSWAVFEIAALFLLFTGVHFWKIRCHLRNLCQFYAVLCTTCHGLHTCNLLPMPLIYMYSSRLAIHQNAQYH